MDACASPRDICNTLDATRKALLHHRLTDEEFIKIKEALWHACGSGLFVAKLGA